MNMIPNIDVAVDINSLAPVFIDHILNVNDTNSRTFSVSLYANNQKISLYSGNFTAKAAISVNNILLDDNVTALIQTDSTVAVTVDNKYLTLIPGVMKIQLTITGGTGGTDVIVTPLPILARVTSDLAQTAQILPDSHSSYSEIVAEIVAARGDYDNLAQALNHLMGFLTSATVDNATETGKVYYTTVGSSKALIVPVSGDSSQVQFRLDRDGKIYARRRSRSSTSVDFPAWGSFADIAAGVDPGIIRQIVEAYIEEHGIDLTGVERTENRVNAINAQSDDEHYPTAKAVYDYAASKASYNYLNNQFTQLVNDVAQLPTTADVQQMIDDSIGGVLSGEY